MTDTIDGRWIWDWDGSALDPSHWPPLPLYPSSGLSELGGAVPTFAGGLMLSAIQGIYMVWNGVMPNRTTVVSTGQGQLLLDFRKLVCQFETIAVGPPATLVAPPPALLGLSLAESLLGSLQRDVGNLALNNASFYPFLSDSADPVERIFTVPHLAFGARDPRIFYFAIPAATTSLPLDAPERALTFKLAGACATFLGVEPVSGAAIPTRDLRPLLRQAFACSVSATDGTGRSTPSYSFNVTVGESWPLRVSSCPVEAKTLQGLSSTQAWFNSPNTARCFGYPDVKVRGDVPRNVLWSELQPACAAAGGHAPTPSSFFDALHYVEVCGQAAAPELPSEIEPMAHCGLPATVDAASFCGASYYPVTGDAVPDLPAALITDICGVLTNPRQNLPEWYLRELELALAAGGANGSAATDRGRFLAWQRAADPDFILDEVQIRLLDERGALNDTREDSGELEAVPRRAGVALAHDGGEPHGVTALVCGTRYGLFLAVA